jgi:Predicted acetyltransferases and hydrolases with the alpha/beta hydrolase fold
MNVLLALLLLVWLGALLPGALGTAINLTWRGEPLRPSRAGVSCFLREWAVHVLLVPLHAVGWWRRPPMPSGEADDGVDARLPVILVPGYAMNRGYMSPLALFLRRQGWRWVWPINNRPASAPIPVYARKLAEAVEELCQRTGAEQVDLVAHSMGGVIAGWYVNRMDGARRVRRMVTVATPWRGTMMHVWGLLRQARDMAPESDVIAGIQQPAVPVTAIWSRSDQIVIPPEHSVCDGVEAIELAHAGHMEMLLSARVWRLVADALATSEVQPEAGAEASADAVEAGADDKARKPEAESA